MKIALFGGTFNPIHYGHLLLAEISYDEFKLDKVIFIPSGQPPHKLESGFKIHRYNMVKLAIGKNKHFMVSDYEIKKNTITYTYDTIKYFKQKYYGHDIYFLIGLDLLLEMHTWKGKETVLDLCTFLVGTRPNYPISKVPLRIRSKVNLFKLPLFDISSTEIRERIRQNKTIKYLVPEPVEKYIFKNKLYI
jgi:nicotinate-nucleotide adenylyltransferase